MTQEAVIKSIQVAQPPKQEPWPAPDMKIVNGYKPEAKEFPVEVFGEVWGDFICRSAESKSCPPDYVVAGLLASASALIGNSYMVSPWEGWTEPAIIWPCCVGLPSSGKTPGLSVCTDTMNELEKETNMDFEDRKLDYEGRKELAKAKRDKWQEALKKAVGAGGQTPDMPEDAMEPEKPSRNRLIIKDATVEIIAPIVASNPKGIMCFRDELSGWFGAMNQYKSSGGADRAFWLEAYNGKDYTVDRAKAGLNGAVNVPRLCISIVGGIQPDKLVKVLLKDADDGMAARFTFLWPESVAPRQPTTRPNMEAAKDALRRLRDLKMISHEDGSLTPCVCLLEASAQDALNDYRQDIYKEEKSASGLYLSYIGKNAGRALRLALVIEFLIWCAEGGNTPPDMVSEKSLLSALSLLSQYFDPMARRAFDNAALPERLRDAATIAKWLQRTKCKKTSTREIQRQRIGGLDNAQAIGDAVEELVEAGWLRPDPENTGTGGRNKKSYQVNPVIYGGKL